MINILILEDHELLSKRLSATLKEWHYCAHVFECTSNKDAAKIMGEHHIDLLLADLNVSDGDGILTIKQLAHSHPDAITIVMSGVADPARIISAIKSGAIGYLHKSDTTIQLIGSIEKALLGQSPISAEIAMVLCKSIYNVDANSDFSRGNNILTPRETQVIELISRGLSNSEVAMALSISVNTLPVHIRNIYSKLQTNNRTEAVFEARSLGILK